MDNQNSPNTSTLTINEALIRAVEHHRAGRLDEAERFYRAILDAQSGQPDANHNMGILLTQIGKPELAQANFKLAFEAFPGYDQYADSYIGSLIGTGQFKTARDEICKARASGVSQETLAALDLQLSDAHRAPRDKMKLTKPSRSKLKQAKNKSSFSLAEAKNKLATIFNKRDFESAEALARKMSHDYPNESFGWKVLGAVFKERGLYEEALAMMQRALSISPLEAEIHNNLGTLMMALEHYEEAELHLQKAISLNSGYTEAHYNLGNLRMHLGQMDLASKDYQLAIELNPGYVFAYLNLGNLHMKSDKFEAAAACFEQALLINSEDSSVLNNLGHVYRMMSRLTEAETYLSKAIDISPEFAEAFNNLGLVKFDQLRYDEAESCYRSAIKLKPGYALCLVNLGALLQKLGRNAEAEDIYRSAIAIDQDIPEAYNNQGNLMRDLGRLKEAAGCYRIAIAKRPSYARALSMLGITLADLGELDEAEQISLSVLDMAPEDSETHSALAYVLQSKGLPEKAAQYYRNAVALNPENAEHRYNLGHTLKELGKLEEAQASMEKALLLNPDFAECYRNLGNYTKYVTDDHRIPQLRKILRETRSESDRIHAAFALAKACEDLKEYEEAFTLYAEGNQLRKQMLGYHIEQDAIIFRMIKYAFGFLPEAEPAVAHSTTPILIVGMPRSGTSLVEQILATHSQVHGAGELEILSRIVQKQFIDTPVSNLGSTSRTIATTYFEELEKLSSGRSYVTDKMPQNFRFLGFLLLANPAIRIVHTIRDPMAVCWSIYRQYFPAQGMGFGYDLSDLAEYYKMYEDLMKFWHERFPGRIYDLNYEELTENQEESTRALLEYCKLPWEGACLEFYKTDRAVRTASAAQVRKKLYKGSSQVWRKFETHLGSLKAGLEIAQPAPAATPKLPDASRPTAR